MPRKPREIIPNTPHHLTQRTIRRLPLFESEMDRIRYIELLSEQCEQFGIAIYSYCLMDNHIHLVAVPPDEDSLSKGIRNAHSRYARYFNAKNGFVGHLMQSRFYSCPMDEKYMWHAIRYVERNPVEAGMVKHAADYKWSSAPFRCKQIESDPLVLGDLPNQTFVSNWYEWLSTEGELSDTKKLVNATIEGSWVGHRAPSP